MNSIESFRIQNLRCIKDSGEIQLKPITILVGRNSSGKSTLARVFPLLKQSAETDTRGPILWWGKLVDFGDFETAVYKNSTTKEIILDLKISHTSNDNTIIPIMRFGKYSLLRLDTPGSIELNIKLKNLNSITYTSSISISKEGYQAALEIDHTGAVTSLRAGNYTWVPSESATCNAIQNQLIPNIYFKNTQNSSAPGRQKPHNPIENELVKCIRNMINKNNKEENILDLARKIPLAKKEEIYQSWEGSKKLKKEIKKSGIDSESFKKMCNLNYLLNLNDLLTISDRILTKFLDNLDYKEPLRATAERYYRQQPLAAGKIDSKGANTAIFLASLTEREKEYFNDWTLKHLGFKVTTKEEGGHISIEISTDSEIGGIKRNIADMGFGYSQMIPLIAQLWATEGLRQNYPSPLMEQTHRLMVIEQPELHLHPEYQARIAKIFVAAVNGNKDLRIIAETHSHALINRLGYLISKNEIDRDHVQVLIFEQSQEQPISKIRVACFDNHGILKNWPCGFFEPTLDD